MGRFDPDRPMLHVEEQPVEARRRQHLVICTLGIETSRPTAGLPAASRAFKGLMESPAAWALTLLLLLCGLSLRGVSIAADASDRRRLHSAPDRR
jgi:hypothetical protein